jgi:hypothetical protein
MSLGDAIHAGRLHAAAPQGLPSASAGGGAGRGCDTGGGSAGRRMPYVDRVLHVLLDIAAGMAHIHAKSVIHGDLKPQVAFDPRGGGRQSTSGWWGIAHLVGGGKRRSGVAQCGVGTPRSYVGRRAAAMASNAGQFSRFFAAPARCRCARHAAPT